jgi:hypothetical protein
MTKLILAGAAALAVATGAAAAEERTYNFKDFEAVSASAGTHVQIKTNPEFSIRAVGDAEAIERLKVELEGKTLEIGRKPGVRWERNSKVTVYVTLPDLKALAVSSGAHATAAGVADGPFALDGSSGGHGEVSGDCGALSAEVSSGAHLDADRLLCRTASADASSGGHLKISVSESLDADASSGGHIEVSGNPKNANVEKSSGGHVSVE